MMGMYQCSYRCTQLAGSPMLKQTTDRLKRISLVSFLLLLLPSLTLADEPDLVLNTWASAPLSRVDQSGYLDQIIIEAFRRINLKIDIEQKPVERSITDANNGRGDGEFIRVQGLSKIYPNLIQVPEKIFDFEFVVFTKKQQLIINDWGSLKPFYVGIVIGWKILEKNIQNVRYRINVTGPEALFSMLDLGRIDIAVYSKFLGLEVVKNLGLKDIVVNSNPLAVKPMYLYLHKKHRDIVADVAKSLKSMKDDGTFLTIKNAYLLRQITQPVME